jgi:hypothetical protein
VNGDGKIGEEEAWLRSFLTSALGRGERSSSLFGRFIPRERIPALNAQDAGWDPQPICTSLYLPRIEPRIV